MLIFIKKRQMEQLVLDISSEKDAVLIKELLKRFKGVQVNDFSPSHTSTQMRKRIEKGIEEADNGELKPWKEVKAKLIKRIKASGK
jgi:hypothetical protein